MNEGRIKMHDDNCNYKVHVEDCAVPAPSESMKDVIMELHDMTMKARSMSEEIRDKLFGMEPVKDCEAARDGNCAFDALCETRRITKYLLENLYSVIQRIEG